MWKQLKTYITESLVSESKVLVLEMEILSLHLKSLLMLMKSYR